MDLKLPNRSLKEQNLIPISEAAEFLGCSIDTVRRWDKAGKIHSTRPNGKDRYFSLKELQRVKFSKPLSITEAAEKLHLSASTLRRLEQKEIITPKRDANGVRLYDEETLADFINSEYYMSKKKVEKKILTPLKEKKPAKVVQTPINPVVPEAPKPSVNDLVHQPKVTSEEYQRVVDHVLNEQQKNLNRLKRAKKVVTNSATFIATTFVMLVSLITIFFLMFPQETSEFFGYNHQFDALATEQGKLSYSSLQSKVETFTKADVLGASVEDKPEAHPVGQVLKPFSSLSLGVVKRVDEETYRKIVPEKVIEDINEVFAVNNEGALVILHDLSFAENTEISLPDDIDASSVQGRTPGSSEGDLAVFGEDGSIAGLTITGGTVTGTLALSDGDVTGGTGGIILDGSITAADLADASITVDLLADEAVTGEKIEDATIEEGDLADDAVTSDKIEDGTIASADIASNTITAADLAATLTFADGDFIDLSALDHSDTAPQGLLLPNVSSATPSSPSTGEGYLSYDTTGDQVIVYTGSSWVQVGSGDITGVTAGTGLTGGGLSGDVTVNVAVGNGLSVAADEVNLDVTTSGTTAITSANSGLELASDGLSLLRGCSDNQILKWDSGSGVWQCENDSGGGGGSIDVEEGDSLAVSSASSIDFLAADFTVSESPAGEGNISIDYANSNIVRSNQAETITGGWVFSTLATTFSSAVDINSDVTIADTDIALDGASTNFTATGDLSFNGDDLFIDKTTGRVGIGTTGPSTALEVSGTATATTFADGTATLSSGTLDLGTNTIADGSLTGNWSFNSGNATGINNLAASGTVTFDGIGIGTDNTVLVVNGSGSVLTDEIDSRVWGSTLLDDSDIGVTVQGYNANTTILGSTIAKDELEDSATLSFDWDDSEIEDNLSLETISGTPIVSNGLRFGTDSTAYLIDDATNGASSSTLYIGNESILASGDIGVSVQGYNANTTILGSTISKDELANSGTLAFDWGNSEIADDLTISGGSIDTSSITLVNSTGPTPTTEGVIEWDSNDDRIVVGDGAGGQIEFYGGTHTTDTQLSEAAVEGYIFDGDNSGTLSSGIIALDSVSYTGTLDDTNINDALTLETVSGTPVVSNGVRIGTDDTDSLIDDASNGSGSNTLYIGNESILASGDIGVSVQGYNVNTTTLGSSISLTSEVTGTLAVGNGGTGATTFASNGILYGNGTSAIQATAAGSNGYILYSNSGTPAWLNPTSLNAGQVDGFDGADLLRSNASDEFEGGNTLTLTGTVDSNGDISFADTSIVFDGASTNFAATGDLTINDNDLFVEKSSGYIGISNTNPGYELDVAGALNTTSFYIGGSQVTATATELNLLDGRTGILLDTNNVASQLSAWDQDSSNDLTTATSFSGDVTGNYNSTVVGDDSHAHTSATLPATTTYLGSAIGKDELEDSGTLAFDWDDTEVEDNLSLETVSGTPVITNGVRIGTDDTDNLIDEGTNGSGSATLYIGNESILASGDIGVSVQAYNANTTTLGSTISKDELENSGTLAFDWADSEIADNLSLETVSGTPVVSSGLRIGTDTTNYLIDDASNGAGSSTLYIGNESILASGDIGVSVQGYDANTSILGSSIDTTEITNDSILEIDLDVTNSPSDNFLLTFDNGTSGFTWVDPSTIGGTIDGSGAGGYTALWSDSDTLTSSSIYETGGQIGIGTTNPSVALDIAGALNTTGNIDAGGTLQAGSGNITLTNSTGYVLHDSLVDCSDGEILKWSTGGSRWGCGSDSVGGGGGSLDDAYNDSTATVIVDAYDLLLELNDSSNDYGLVVDNTTTGDIATAFEITTTGAGGTFATAIDLTDGGITTALSVATADIVGTTGDINYSNFDVTGSSGDITTSGDIALNGGDITTTQGNLVMAVNGSSTGDVHIGSTSASTSPDLLVLDRKTDAGNPTGENGALYVNSSNKLMINESGTWKEVCNKTDAACGAGSGSAWSALSAPASNLSLTHDEYTTAFTWDTASTAAAFDGFTLSLTNDASTDSNTQRVAVIQNNNASGSTNTETLLLLNNADTDEAVTTALEITSADGAITTAVDVSDPQIVTALDIGENTIVTGATTIASTELDLLDGGITLGELTDTGTLTATTVDINGGNIDGTAIGSSSASSGAFTTLSSTGVTTIGNNSATVAIDSSDWDISATGDATGFGAITADGTVTFTGIGTGTDNSVVVVNGSDQIVTDEIDPRVWGATLVDYSSTTTNYLPLLSDADTLINSSLYETGGSVGIGTTAPTDSLHVAGNIFATTGFHVGSDTTNTLIDDASNGSGSATLYIGDESILASGDIGVSVQGYDANTTTLGSTISKDELEDSGTLPFDWDDSEVEDNLSLETISGTPVISNGVRIGTDSTDNLIDEASNGVDSSTLYIGNESILASGDLGVSVQGYDANTTILGATIGNSELDNDTIDFDKIAASLTLDEETTISAGGALNFQIGNNVTMQATGSGSIIATDLSCTNCIGATELADITLGTDTAGDYVASFTAGAGLTGDASGEGSTPTLAVGAGIGITVNTNDVAVDQDAVFAWSADHTYTFVNTEDLAINLSVSGTNSGQAQLVTITNTSSSGTQNGIIVDNAASTGTTESLLQLDNSDTDTAVTNGIQFVDAGGGFTNLFNVDGTLISESEFTILDGGIANSELIDSGTFTATTVDINGGNIDGTAIGSSSASSGAFTTLSSTGVTTIGNNSATVAIDSSDWDISATGDATGLGAVTADGTVTFTGIGTGTDNTVVVVNGSDQLVTDEIDSRVWGSTLLDDTDIGVTVQGYNANTTILGSTIGNSELDDDTVDFDKVSDNLTLDATTAADLYTGAADADFRFYNSDAGVELLFLDGSADSVGIGNTAPTDTLHVTGNILATTGFHVGADNTDNLIDDATNGSGSTTLYIGNESILASGDIGVTVQGYDADTTTLGSSIEKDELADSATLSFDWDDTEVEDNLSLETVSGTPVITNGVRIGTDNTNNLIDEATNGSGSATLYIGNESILASGDIGVSVQAYNANTTILGAAIGKDEIENTGTLSFDWADSEVADSLSLETVSGTPVVSNGLRFGTDSTNNLIDDASNGSDSATLYIGDESILASGDIGVSVQGYDANTSQIGQTIETSEITDDEILEEDLDITNTVSDNFVLTADTGSGGFTWVDPTTIGAFDGTGTAGYTSLWSDSDTLTASSIYETGGQIGIGTTNPGDTLHVVGNVFATTGFHVGADSDNNLIDDSSTGSGSATLYIGNESILASGDIGVTVQGYNANTTILGSAISKDELENSGSLAFDWADSEIADALSLETVSGTPVITNGVRIGTDNTNNLIDEASNGAGSTTLYIGNESILASGDIGVTVQGYDANTTILGATIGNSELDDDTINYDKISASLTLDEETTLSAAGSLNYLIGNNVTLTTTGSGSIVATDLSCTNCIGATELADITLGTDTAGDYVASFTAGGGLTGDASGEGSTPTLAVGAGTGITVNANDVAVDQDTSFTWTADHTYNLSETEDLAVNVSISGSNSGQGEVVTITNSSSSGSQYGVVVDNAASSGTTESLLLLDNSDTDTAVTNGIQFVDAGGGFTNLFNVDGTLISESEFTLLDGGVLLSELTDTGTFTATTVDINGGNIDGTAIGSSSASSGAFTTLASTGVTTIGNNSATVAIDSSDWDISATGDATGLGAVTADGTITFTGIGTGTDNTVVVVNGSDQLVTDEIDSRVWGSTLLDDTDIGVTVQGYNANTTVLGSTIGNSELDDDTIDFDKISDALTLDAITAADLYTGAADVDFRFYNSDSNGELLFLDGSADSVGIGNTAPTDTLHVTGDILATTGFHVGADADNNLLDDASNGSGSATLYIGNESILASGDIGVSVQAYDANTSTLGSSIEKDELADSATLSFDWDDTEVEDNLSLETVSGTPVITNGVRIGTDNTNNLIDEASNGAGSATLYIGNESILASGDIGVTVQGYDANTTVLGSTIGNSELDNDTIDFDKITASLTLDEETTIAAGSALNLLIGNNVTFTTTGSGAITATDLSCTNCIGATEISDLALGTDTSGDYVASFTAGAGLTGDASGEGSTPTLAVGAGTGITSNANDVAVDVDTSFGWTADHTWTLAETEDLAVNVSISGSNSGQGELVTLTNSSSSGSQYGIVIDNAASSGTSEALLRLDNSDTDTAVTDGIEFVDAGGGFTNLFDVAGTLISTAEFTILDGGIANSELTDSGTFTAGTVDINGGNIDGTTIGSSSAAAGTFSQATITTGALAVNSDSITSDGATLTINAGGTVDIQDAVTVDSLTVDTGNVDIAGTIEAGSGDITLTNSTGYVLHDALVDCADGEILKWSTGGGRWGCSTDQSGGGAGSLDDSYDNGGSITVDAYDVLFDLNDASNDYGIVIDNNTTGAIATALEFTTAGAGGTFATAIDATDDGITTALSVATADIVGTTGDINFTNFDVTGSSGDIVTAGTLAVNGDSITADGATLTINAGGTVDIQDALTADSVTVDSGNLDVQAGTIDGATTLSSTTSDNLGQLTLTNSTSSGTQHVAYFDNAASSGTTEAILVLDNSDTDTAVTNGLHFIDAGGGFTNLFNVDGTLISEAEFTILDGGIANSELTDSGTLTATTVDINGGNIDGTAIGVSSQSSGSFTTLASTGVTTIGNNSATVAIDSSDWDISATGDATGLGAVTADGTITFTGIGTGTDNTVVVVNGSDQLVTDEIDSRVWGSTLLDDTDIGATVQGYNANTTVLGSTIGNSELDDDTIDFDKISDGLTLDATTAADLYTGAADVDFRFYNSDSTSELLFLDGSADSVGIGNTAPTDTLHVAGNILATTGFHVGADADNNLLDDASNGSGSATLYIGNESILASGDIGVSIQAYDANTSILGSSIEKDELADSATLSFDWDDTEVEDNLSLETVSGTPVITNGVRIGTDNTNNLIDEASNGAGSATLYIGNESILASGDIGASVQGYDANTTVLGSTIGNSELDDDTVDFDKIANALTLDEETTISAGSALNFQIGNNVTLQVTGSGSIIATDLSCTNCIGATEISDLTLGTDTAGDYVESFTAGGGLTGDASGEGSTPTLAVGAGTGITVNTNDVAVDEDTSFGWTADHTWTLAETEDLAVNVSISGSNSGQGEVITLTNSSSSGSQYGLVLDNAASSGTTESLLRIDNSDTDTAVTDGIEFVDAGGGFTNLFDVAGTLISTAEFTILDGGIALSELTDSGTLTAGTVDINGGNIDGTAIGGSSQSSGSFTTLASTGVTTIGNDSATVAIDSSDWDISTTGAITGVSIDANGTGNSITNIESADIANDTIVEEDLNAQGTLTDEYCLTYETGGGALFEWQSCGGGGGGSLDDAYNDSTATVIVDAYDVTFELNDSSSDYGMVIDNTTTGAIATALEFTTTGAGGTFATGIDLSDGGITTALSLGGNDISGAGYQILSTASGLTIDSTSADLALSTTTSGNITATTSTASALFNVLSGNLKVGDGTPGVTQDGEDAYIEGTLEVDSAVTFDNGLTLTAGALAVNSDSITADGATLTINAGGTVDIQDALSVSGGLSGVTTIASSDDWTWSATTPAININSTEVFSVSDGTDTFTVDTSGSVLSYSDGSNSFTFDVDTGPSYAGTARPSKSIVLSPEYQGGVLTAYYGSGTDSNITGTMSSDVDTSQGTSIRNYYSWERSGGTQHFYTVAVRVTLPPDFSAWATSNALDVEYITESATSTNSDVDVYVYNENSATIVASDIDNASTSWATATIDDSTLDDGASSEWDAAGETAVIYLRMGSQSGNYARVGDITLNYLGAY